MRKICLKDLYLGYRGDVRFGICGLFIWCAGRIAMLVVFKLGSKTIKLKSMTLLLLLAVDGNLIFKISKKLVNPVIAF